ncbi:MAG: hypothetical protein KatS3mg103_0374 [Phycisphaerales bacterium]|nr:MAG: hypothetical protein KatS3mg103_0374 [Phycisphaerales bacterium]
MASRLVHRAPASASLTPAVGFMHGGVAADAGGPGLASGRTAPRDLVWTASPAGLRAGLGWGQAGSGRVPGGSGVMAAPRAGLGFPDRPEGLSRLAGAGWAARQFGRGWAAGVGRGRLAGRRGWFGEVFVGLVHDSGPMVPAADPARVAGRSNRRTSRAGPKLVPKREGHTHPPLRNGMMTEHEPASGFSATRSRRLEDGGVVRESALVRRGPSVSDTGPFARRGDLRQGRVHRRVDASSVAGGGVPEAAADDPVRPAAGPEHRRRGGGGDQGLGGGQRGHALHALGSSR